MVLKEQLGVTNRIRSASLLSQLLINLKGAQKSIKVFYRQEQETKD